MESVLNETPKTSLTGLQLLNKSALVFIPEWQSIVWDIHQLPLTIIIHTISNQRSVANTILNKQSVLNFLYLFFIWNNFYIFVLFNQELYFFIPPSSLSINPLMTYRNSKVKRPEVDWPDSKHLILTCKTRDTGGSGIRDTVLKEGSFCSFIFTAPGFLFGLQYFNFSWFPIWKRRKFGKEESVHTGSWKSSKNHRDLRGGETQVQHPLFRWKPWESGKLQGLSKVTYSCEQGPSMEQRWQRDRNSPTVTAVT